LGSIGSPFVFINVSFGELPSAGDASAGACRVHAFIDIATPVPARITQRRGGLAPSRA
jgi:hypothetical protein